MVVVNYVVVSNLGNSFDIGAIEPNKIHVKYDNSTIVRDAATGALSVAPSIVAGATAPTNALSLAGNLLTSTVNGVVATQDLSGILSSTTNALSVAGAILTSTVNGVDATQDLTSAVAAATTHTMSLTGNVLTSVVNGVSADQDLSSVIPPITNALSVSGVELTSTVNGVASTQDMTSIVAAATTNTLSLAGAILTSDVNGVTAMQDLEPAVKAAETVTSLTYDAATTMLTYTNEAGTAGVIDLSALTTDIYVNGGAFDAATMVLTLTDNDGASPDITVDLSDLKKVETVDTDSIAFMGDGSAAAPLSAELVVDSVAGNLLTVSAAGAAVLPTAIEALATVDVQDAFGNHMFFAFP